MACHLCTQKEWGVNKSTDGGIASECGHDAPSGATLRTRSKHQHHGPICDRLWEQAREETNLSRASDWAAAVSATPELTICDSLAESQPNRLRRTTGTGETDSDLDETGQSKTKPMNRRWWKAGTVEGDLDLDETGQSKTKKCSCGRKAAGGYDTCCWRCPATGGERHGPICKSLWEQAREETNLSRASSWVVVQGDTASGWYWVAAASATSMLAICDSLSEPQSVMNTSVSQTQEPTPDPASWSQAQTLDPVAALDVFIHRGPWLSDLLGLELQCARSASELEVRVYGPVGQRVGSVRLLQREGRPSRISLTWTSEVKQAPDGWCILVKVRSCHRSGPIVWGHLEGGPNAEPIDTWHRVRRE